jgi:hypothetical protein
VSHVVAALPFRFDGDWGGGAGGCESGQHQEGEDSGETAAQ